MQLITALRYDDGLAIIIVELVSFDRSGNNRRSLLDASYKVAPWVASMRSSTNMWVKKFLTCRSVSIPEVLVYPSSLESTTRNK